MVPIASLLLLLVLSLVITRVASVALSLTGLSIESARFQARSAYTGVGFTTAEAESVVGHPVRRRIVMLLMLLGNVGAVTVVSSVIISAIDLASPGPTLPPLLVLIAGVTGIVIFAHSRAVDVVLSRVIAQLLRRFTTIEVHDYANLLHLSGQYGVVELPVEKDRWLTHAPLCELDLPLEGVLVLGVQSPSGQYVGAPQGDTTVQPGDVLILYGATDRLAKIEVRRPDAAGEQCRREGISEHERRLGS